MTSQRTIAVAVVANLLLIAIAIILGLVTSGKPSRFFGEGRFTTLFSCAQLLATAYYSSRIFQVRRPRARRVGSISAAWVWAFIAAGFVFLAADEAFEIHERLDLFVHRILQIQETGWTDRLDDAIIAMYGVIGLAILWLFRDEILICKEIRRPLGVGFLCVFASVFCDAISNRDDVLSWLCGDVLRARQLRSWFDVGDGAFTLLAEGLFLAAFYLAYRATLAHHHGVHKRM